jgi:uncharacterized integral membrane protein
MIATISFLLVPALTVVVLSALIITSRREYHSFGVGVLGVMGVILGGPGAALLFAANSAESNSAKSALHDPIRVEEVTADADDFVRANASRPSWVDEMPNREDRIHTQVVSSGPHVRVQDAYKALDEQLKEETDAYVRWYLASDEAARTIDLDLQYIKTHLRDSDLSHSETRDYSVGPMRTMYGRLEFDEQFRRQLDEQWHNEVSKNRLWITALAGGGVFVLLLTVFAYFRLDTATRGYYTGRLQFLTVAAILALVAAGVMAVNLVGIEWLT